MIEKSMHQYLAENAGLKYVFFGGKGGVGKTVLAGAAALWAARQGKKTLLASTNPVHSLSSLLGQDVFGKPTSVRGAANLDAYEIDTRETIEKSKKSIQEKIEWFLQYAEIKTKADEFVQSATMNPSKVRRYSAALIRSSVPRRTAWSNGPTSQRTMPLRRCSRIMWRTDSALA